MTEIINANLSSASPASQSQGQNIRVVLNKKSPYFSDVFQIESGNIWEHHLRITKDYEIEPHISLSEGVVIHNWKNVQNISARLLASDDEKVLLECLVDRENKVYEEREFKLSLFKNMDLKIGKLFKLCFYERQHQQMIEVKDNPKLVSETDFPRTSFKEKYSGMPLKKSK